MSLEDDLEERITDIYNRAAAEVTRKFEKYMEDFRRKDREKRRLVESGKLSESEYIKWRKGQVLIGSRWREMKDVLSQDLVNADKIAASTIGEFMPSAYAVGHNYGTFQIETGSLIDTSYTLYSRETVERLIRESPRLLNVTKWELKEENKDKRWNQQHITQQITQGILQGEDIRQVSGRLQRVVGMDKQAAMRNARTAMTGAQNGGRVDAYQRAADMGIKVEKEWLATMDSHTRDSHIDMDGEHVPVDAVFSNGVSFPGEAGGPPAEVYNCRCTLIPRLADVDYSKDNDLRWRRDEDLDGMSYDEWKKSRTGARSYFHKIDAKSFVEEKESRMTQEDIDRINKRYAELDKKYHAIVSNVRTTLSQSQHEYDLYYENAIKNYREQYPKKRMSTIEKMVTDMLGPRPEKADLSLGGNYWFDSNVLTINPRAVGIEGGIKEDIANRLKYIEHMKERVAQGKRFRPFGNVGDTFEATFIHEYGHAIDCTYGIAENPDFLQFYRQYSEEQIERGVSSYATTNEREFIAECFADSFMGETQSDISREFMERLGGWMK